MKQNKNATTCPACIFEQNKIIGKHRDFLLLECIRCGLRYSDPMQEPNPIFYQNSFLYRHRYKKNILDLKVDESNILKNWRFRTVLADMQNKTKNLVSKKVMDIGCGEGSFLYAAEKRGFKVSGIDFDKRAVDFAREVLNLKNVKETKLSNIKQNKKYDFITLFETLEHVQNPFALMKTLINLLVKDGYLYVSVPSYDRNPKLFNLEADYPPHHLTLWTKKALKNLLKRSGFAKTKIIEKPLSGEDLQLHLIWWVKRKLGKRAEENPELFVGKSNKVTLKRISKKILFSLSLIIFEILALIFRFSGKSRGQTYLVITTKI